MRKLTVLLVLLLGSSAVGQPTAAESGVPGDGIPDVYYYPDAGLLQLDTDGADFAGLLVSDPDAIFLDGCILCDGDAIDAPPPPGHFYVLGNINDSTQWIRTFPLFETGPLGVFNLTIGPPGLDQSYFTEIFDDQFPEDLWSFRYTTDSSGQFFSNVTVMNANTIIDFDHDGTVDTLDINSMTLLGNLENGVPTSITNLQYDLIPDGVIDAQDLDEFLSRAAMANGLGSPYRRGDADLNGVVDEADFATWNQFKFTSGSSWSQGDFTGNGIIDGADFFQWNANKFTSSSSVPEPSGVWLLCGALALWRGRSAE